MIPRPGWIKPVAIGVGILALVVGTLLIVNHIYGEGEDAGAAKVETKVQERTIATQRSIQDAESRGPRTQRDVSKRLREGTF